MALVMVEIHGTDGAQYVYIETSAVQYIEPISDEACSVVLTGSKTFRVEGCADVVASLMNAAENGDEA
jgi:hypothetical protein